MGNCDHSFAKMSTMKVSQIMFSNYAQRTPPLVSRGPFLESAENFSGPKREEPFVKLRPAYSVKLVFSYVVKGVTIKISAKCRASRRVRFEDTKRIMPPEMRPKSFGTLKKQAPE